MKKLPSWANCWIVDINGNKLPADRYAKSTGTFYYDDSGHRIKDVSHEIGQGAGWFIAMIIIMAAAWIWGAAL